MDRETAEEIKRHFNVVAEGLRSEIRALAEGVERLQQTVSSELGGICDYIRQLRTVIRLTSTNSKTEWAAPVNGTDR